MSNSPNTILASRAALVIAALGAAVLMLGPFQGAERLFFLSDKEAHAAAFFCLTALTFVAAPNLRRNDIAFAAIALGAAAEVAQAGVGRDGNVADLMADAVGVFAVWAPAYAESLRARSRKARRTDRRTTSVTSHRRSAGSRSIAREDSASVAARR